MMLDIIPMGQGCPCCRNHQTEGGGLTVKDDRAYQPMFCPDCGAEWQDIYRLEQRVLKEDRSR
ncbi:hypothetical protein [Photobacterium sp. OFAV2-7]|uniref:hypothetical protein n=1 Tax=Photobacterium sp. OFAV2-7 TaxID=2917748 RepID=UPI001EF71F6E|nr:hypothetical protein [Photobacterium sp. OFAV2-7]MCG7584588.1 hypothetical protein [Photobacterium sp. OFAV2-7]